MTEPHGDALRLQPPSAEVVARWVQGHRDFLAFLEPRLPNRAAAEEVLQAAFVRSLERGGTIRDPDSAVAWFYRLLRNALTDFYRRRSTERSALSREAAEPREPNEQELQRVVCACIVTLLPTLKREYHDLLQRVDLDGESLATAAAQLGISLNNATVRLHRARQALKRQLEQSCGTCANHGCLDCSCGTSGCS